MILHKILLLQRFWSIFMTESFCVKKNLEQKFATRPAVRGGSQSASNPSGRKFLKCTAKEIPLFSLHTWPGTMSPSRTSGTCPGHRGRPGQIWPELSRFLARDNFFLSGTCPGQEFLLAHQPCVRSFQRKSIAFCQSGPAWWGRPGRSGQLSRTSRTTLRRSFKV